MASFSKAQFDAGIAVYRADAPSGGERVYKILKDGTKSRTMSSTVSVNSGIAGFFDRNAHYDFCRTTSFTKRNLAKFQGILPPLRAECFLKNL